MRGIRGAGTLAAAVTFVFGAVGCTAHHAAAPATPAPVAQSAWEKVVGQTGTDGRVDVAAALSAFALAIGPVPGATVPAGPSGTIPSGTIAVKWVLSHWADLTAAQRTAVLADLGVPRPGTAPAKYVPTPGAVPAKYLSQVPQPATPAGPVCPTADGPGAQKYRAWVPGIESDLASHFGHPFAFPNTVFVFVDKREAIPGAGMYEAPCFTAAPAGTGTAKITGCTVHVNPTPEKVAADEAELHTALLHEMTHCYLDGRFGLAYDQMPSWYIEGVPMWVESQLGTASGVLTWSWQNYLSTFYWPLYRRTYSGLGFFVHLAETGTDVWKAVDTIGAAMAPLSSNGPIAQTGAGWAAAVGADFLDSWGSGFAQGRYPGRPWTSTGTNLQTFRPPLYGTLGTKDYKTTRAAPGPLRNGGTVTFTADVYAADIEQLDVEAEVVTSTPGDASTGRISLGGSRDAPLNGGPFCTVADCACPKGSPGEGTRFVALSAGPQYVGLTGGSKAGTVTLAGQALAAFCGKPGRPCLVGQWTATGLAAHGTFAENGGAGVRLHIDPQGRLTTVFDGMAAVSFTASIAGQQVAGHYVFTGSDSATLVLPPPTATSGDHIDVRNLNESGLNVAMQITSPVSQSITVNAGSAAGAGGAGAAAGGAPTLEHGWSCPDTDTMTATTLISGTSITETGTWTFNRTGPG